MWLSDYSVVYRTPELLLDVVLVDTGSCSKALMRSRLDRTRPIGLLPLLWMCNWPSTIDRMLDQFVYRVFSLSRRL